MKLLLNTCALMLLLVGATNMQLNAQEIPTVQKPLFTKVTATWCPHCGTWGWEYMESMVGTNEEDALIIGAHHSGVLQSAAGQFLQSNFRTQSQPRFVLNNTDLGVSRNNLAEKETEARNVIVAEGTEDAQINVGLIATMGESSIDVKSSTKNFVALDGEYYLALYLIEDKVIATQSSVGPDANHPFVIRTAFGAEQFGTQLFSGAVTDFSYDADHSISIDAEWDTENLYVYGIIWRKEGDTYIYENGNSIKVEAATTSTADHGILAEVSIQPTISKGLYSFSGDPQVLAKAKVEIRDLSGKVIRQFAPGQLNAQAEIDLTQEINGYYVVTLTADQSQKSLRILKQ